MIVRSWHKFGQSIAAEPGLTLAAFLGDAAAAAALKAAKRAVPDAKSLARDADLDEPSGEWLTGEAEHNVRFLRRLALWGPQALTRAAFACAEYQAARQALPKGAKAKLRADALAAVAAWLEAPGDHPALDDVVTRCQKKYRPHTRNPDSEKAMAVWDELGAPWFAAETAASDWSLREYDGVGPREASFTWGNRQSVWPQRAAEAAAAHGSEAEVLEAMRAALLDWVGG